MVHVPVNASGKNNSNIEYLLTMSGNIIPYTSYKADSVQLKTRTRNPEDLENLKVVKGGSWADDIFYLQPAAMILAPQTAQSPNIGFRYIVRVVKIEN